MALSHNRCYPIMDILLLLEYSDSYSSLLHFFDFVMSVVICLVGLVGNAVVIGFIGFIMKKHKSKYWFLNLAIADFLSLLTLPIYSVSMLKGTWTFGPYMCRLFFYFLSVSMFASIFILIALNIARVLSVAQPMFHLRFISPSVSFWICTFLWFIAILLSLPAFYYSGELKIGEALICNYLHTENFSTVVINNGYNVSSENTTRGILISDIYTKLNPYIEQCSDDRCCGGEKALDVWNHMMVTSKRMLIPFFVIGYFIPLFVVIICNITIAVHVRKSKTVNPHRLYRIVLIIIMVFFITWTPSVIAETMLFNAVLNMDLIAMIKVLTFMPLFTNIAYVNSCLNPIVYVLSGGKMRSGLSDFINSIRNNYT